MYNDEENFIAIFTQERALRLLNRFSLHYDLLFIDEAHNILNNNSRSILLSRLISKNASINPNHKVIYLSPLIEDINNIKISEEQSISNHTIKHNLKEPDLYEFMHDGTARLYNRFLNKFYKITTSKNAFAYTIENSALKNFIYLYRPKMIEEFAKVFTKSLPKIKMTDEILELKNILKNEVHKNFYIIDYLDFGLIYLHGKLPDLIKEYLEEKYRKLPELKYIVANKVILEGMNLPIESLFIYNTFNLVEKDLINLIGRVNRLNHVFNESENLNKLIPKVHFVNTKYFGGENSKMENKIKKLRGLNFKDSVDNPMLKKYDIEKKAKSEEAKHKIRSIQENEMFLSRPQLSEQDKLKAYLIESSISDHYDNLDELSQSILRKISIILNDHTPGVSKPFRSLTILDQLNYIFIKDVTSLNDYELIRLKNKSARDYYNSFITNSRKYSLKENIHNEYEYFKSKSKSTESKAFFGRAYGEVSISDNSNNTNYINLRDKTDTELVNLAIIKIKMEEDFISYKLNKLIVFLFDYHLIEEDQYNFYVYGTTDNKKIDLSKYGLNISLISRLSKDNQLQNLKFDEHNNLISDESFNEYLETIDDFSRFEISRFFSK